MSWRTDSIVVVLLVAVTALAFAPVAGHAFVDYDDGLFVYANPHVLGGLSADGLAYAFTSSEHRLWAPLTFLSHMTDVALFGAAGEVRGLPASGWHHLTNLALHAGCAALLYLLLRTATGALWRSALVAALFALHPLHVESVAWISERKTLLSTLLGLACLLAYVAYARRGGRLRFLLALGLLALGLMSKPMLVTWPFVMLLLDWWPLGRLRRESAARLLLEKLPFLALVVASSAVTWMAQRPAMDLMSLVPLGDRLQNAVVACARYVARMLWPTGLAPLYPYRVAIPVATTALALALLGGATWAALRFRKRRPYLATGWFWFLGTLVPVSGLVQVGNHASADRYTYVPLIGLFIVLAWAAGELAERAPALRPALAGVLLVALAACATASSRQLRHWADSESLFRHTCAVTAPNGEAHNGLGRALAAQGRTDEAIAEFQQAVRLLPRYVEARAGLAMALAVQGRPDEARREWEVALEIQPDLRTDHVMRAAMHLAEGRRDEAIAEYRAAVQDDPHDAATRSNLASVLAQAGRLDEAIPHYREAVRLRPDLVPPRLFLGRALAMTGRTHEAIGVLEEASRAEPGDPEILSDLGQAYADAGRLEEAVAAGEQARRMASAAPPELRAEIERRLESWRRRGTAPPGQDG